MQRSRTNCPVPGKPRGGVGSMTGHRSGEVRLPEVPLVLSPMQVLGVRFVTPVGRSDEPEQGGTGGNGHEGLHREAGRLVRAECES